MVKFVPRTLAQSQQALGPVDDPAIAMALQVGRGDAGAARTAAGSDEEGISAARGGAGEDFQLFRLLSKPKESDWLKSHEEPGQSYPQWLRKMGGDRASASLPRSGCDTLLVCPVGKSFDSEIGRLFMPHLMQYYAAFFPGANIEVLEKPLSLKEANRRVNDFGHDQYLIKDIFSMLHTDKAVVKRRHAYCRLAVTLEDIYPGDEWNFVFGQANMLERVGVFSFARHSPLFYDGVHATEALPALGAKQLMLWMRTNRKTMVHETCHMLGFKHCVFWHCLMNGSNGDHDSNAKTSYLCPVCLRKLLRGLSGLGGEPGLGDIDARYAGMQAVLRELAAERDPAGSSPSLAKDLQWLEFRRAQLEEIARSAPPPPPPPAPAASRAAGAGTRKAVPRFR